MRLRHTNRTVRRGFTLVELLVVVALMTILATMMSYALSSRAAGRQDQTRSSRSANDQPDLADQDERDRVVEVGVALLGAVSNTHRTGASVVSDQCRSRLDDGFPARSGQGEESHHHARPT